MTTKPERKQARLSLVLSGLVTVWLTSGCSIFGTNDYIREREELRQTHPEIYETERHQKASEWEKEQQERESSGRPR